MTRDLIGWRFQILYQKYTPVINNVDTTVQNAVAEAGKKERTKLEAKRRKRKRELETIRRKQLQLERERKLQVTKCE